MRAVFKYLTSLLFLAIVVQVGVAAVLAHRAWTQRPVETASVQP